ncbi:hypothetical protein CDD82_2408 [Ophiocordyceps australis]|uniref:Uncharacterized protein n=1 Tax=Ophiocordyceps australis TaxID=1399860 RepID=A0A2C5ZBY7_9HYPO|nr:hypothetical protein CDD82_2408 [Ophiocordyceps australis]
MLPTLATFRGHVFCGGAGPMSRAGAAGWLAIADTEDTSLPQALRCCALLDGQCLPVPELAPGALAGNTERLLGSALTPALPRPPPPTAATISPTAALQRPIIKKIPLLGRPASLLP